LRQLLQRVPAVVVDACLAVAMAIAVTIAIRLARQEGAERPDAYSAPDQAAPAVRPATKIAVTARQFTKGSRARLLG
jgi:hypothetical protein